MEAIIDAALKIRPVGHNLLVTIERNDQTVGGIIKPDASQSYAKWATVLRIGDEVTNCKEGDVIVIEEYAYKEYVFDGVRIGMMYDNQVKAVLSEIMNVE